MIDFIETSELLVTSSFHAACWATLLKVPVIGIPTTEKFRTMRYQVLLAAADNWIEFIDSAKIYPKARREYIRTNIDCIKKIESDFSHLNLKLKPISTTEILIDSIKERLTLK